MEQKDGPAKIIPGTDWTTLNRVSLIQFTKETQELSSFSPILSLNLSSTLPEFHPSQSLIVILFPEIYSNITETITKQITQNRLVTPTSSSSSSTSTSISSSSDIIIEFCIKYGRGLITTATFPTLPKIDSSLSELPSLFQSKLSLTESTLHLDDGIHLLPHHIQYLISDPSMTSILDPPNTVFLKIIPLYQLESFKSIQLYPIIKNENKKIHFLFFASTLIHKSLLNLPLTTGQTIYVDNGSGEMVECRVESSEKGWKRIDIYTKLSIVNDSMDIYNNNNELKKKSYQYQTEMDLEINQNHIQLFLNCFDIAGERISEIFELAFNHRQALLDLTIEPPRSILLIGATGTGKTLILKTLAQHYNLHVIVVDLGYLTWKYPENMSEGINEAFKKASFREPSLLIFDHLHTLFPLDAESDTERLAFLGGMKTLNPSDNTLVAGCISNKETTHDSIRGIFEETIELSTLPALRAEQLARWYKNIPMMNEYHPKCIVNHGRDLTAAEVIDQVMKIKYDPNSIDLSKMNFDDNDNNNSKEKQDEEFSWDGVGGLEDVKKKLTQNVIWPILRRDDYDQFKVRVPRGVLLYGPPGTGKTLLARHLSKHPRIPFRSVSISSIVKGAVGDAERALVSILDEAVKGGGGILFLDEIDAIVGDKGVVGKLTSVLIHHLDTLPPPKLIILAATNHISVLPDVLTRSLRLDIHIYVPPPSYTDRLSILWFHLNQYGKSKINDVSKEVVEEMVKDMEGWTGADIAECVRSSIEFAIQNDRLNILDVDLVMGVDLVKTTLIRT